MLTTQTTIPTDRPGRYLVQFCRHAAAMNRTGGGHRLPAHHPGAALASGDLQVDATWSDTEGEVVIAPWGRCSLRTSDAALHVRIDAADDDALHALQGVVTRDLERFGRRNRLTVAWPPATPLDADSPEPPPPGTATPPRRGHRATVLVVGLVILAIALHVAFGSTILTAGGWTTLPLGIILAMVAAKLLLIAFGRRLTRRGHGGHGGRLHPRLRRGAASPGINADGSGT